MTDAEMTTFARFAALLRREGFRKTYATTSFGGVRTWRRDEPDGRTLVVAIWGNGSHRVSHEWVGCSDTLPTAFSNESDMFDAIERERTRTDGKYRDPEAHNYEPARAFLTSKQAAPAKDAP